MARANMARRLLLAATGLALFGIAGFILVTQPRPGSLADLTGVTGNATQGEIVFTAAGCASCHMAPGAAGEAKKLLAGGQSFVTGFGTFLAPNISPDPIHGIGGWTLEQFAHAIRDGLSPEGSHYFPALPYAAYNKMTGQDVADLKAYMDGLPPSAEPSKPHEVGFPFNIRRSIGGWKLLFKSRDWQMAKVATPELERGRYLVEALGHCAECHTPRNLLGGLDRSRWMAGAPNPDGKGATPNITPAKLNWSETEIFAYLTTGFTPEFDSVGGHMAHVVDNMAKLPESDVRAVVAYLKALPATE
jgi:mono/diheme cytochrome c family protein